MLSATASLGWLYLWDVEDSINHIDPFIYVDDVNIQVFHARNRVTAGWRLISDWYDQLYSPQRKRSCARDSLRIHRI